MQFVFKETDLDELRSVDFWFQLTSDFRIFVQWQLVKMRIAFGVVLIVCANVNADVSQKPPPKSSNDETAKFDALYEDLFTVFKKGRLEFRRKLLLN